MNEELQTVRQGLRMEQAGGGARRTRSTRVRSRCKRTPDLNEEVRAQMVEALPYIVKANIDKARQGSLTHTKWLVVEMGKAAKAGGDAAKSARASLAALLMEQLGGSCSAGDREGAE